MFGEYFKKLRVSKNITQKQIAEALGKTTMLVSGVETGKNGPFLEADLETVAVAMCLTKEEKRKLFIEASKEKGKLPTHLIDYVINHDEVYSLLEILADKGLEGASLNKIVKYAEGVRGNV